ncbi:MAG: alpha-ketoglutarate-dependent dioxygenase AlkB, partial [Planctomycetaceae bacterium]
MFEAFTEHKLDDNHSVFSGQILPALELSDFQFKTLWELHPAEHHDIQIHGRIVKTPRWQQAYGADYYFSGQTYSAMEIPELLEPVLEWARLAIFQGLNGILVNWYDGRLDHYIGKHRDSVANMIEGAPIATISLGEERKFRMRPWKQSGFQDFPASSGSVFVIPYETNLAWTHEVPP